MPTRRQKENLVRGAQRRAGARAAGRGPRRRGVGGARSACEFTALIGPPRPPPTPPPSLELHLPGVPLHQPGHLEESQRRAFRLPPTPRMPPNCLAQFVSPSDSSLLLLVSSLRHHPKKVRISKLQKQIERLQAEKVVLNEENSILAAQVPKVRAVEARQGGAEGAEACAFPPFPRHRICGPEKA